MSGFLTTCLLSESLSSFCNIKYGTKLSRVDVTKKILFYIRDNKLQNPRDRREILPNDELIIVLCYNEETDGKLTYYSLQKLIQPHFGPNGSKFKSEEAYKKAEAEFYKLCIYTMVLLGIINIINRLMPNETNLNFDIIRLQ